MHNNARSHLNVRAHGSCAITGASRVFGGYDVATKVGFMVPVDRRDAATLLPIIQKYIAPGTTIISDLWAAYNTIGTLGYQHLTVNHSLNFVDPTTGACTNHIESVGQKAKQKHKQRYGTHRELLHTYLADFMWRQRFGCSFHDFVAFMQIVQLQSTQTMVVLFYRCPKFPVACKVSCVSVSLSNGIVSLCNCPHGSVSLRKCHCGNVSFCKCSMALQAFSSAPVAV